MNAGYFYFPEEPAQDEQFLNEIDKLRGMHPSQRDTYIRIKEADTRKENWADQSRDWLGDHPELWDGKS